MDHRETRLNLLYVGMLPPHPGGSGISWSLLLDGLERAGHRVRAIAPITEADLRDGDRFALDHPRLNVRRYTMPYHFTGPNVPAPPDYILLERNNITRLMEDAIGDERPDVVIMGRESFSRPVPGVASRHGIPTMLGIRGNTTMALIRDRYEPGLRDEYLAQFAKADVLVSVARHLADGLRALGFDKLELIENTVDTRRFSPRAKPRQLLADYGLAGDRLVVAHVSNLKAAKRPLDFIAAAARVAGLEPGISFLVVGEGMYRERMESACAAHGMAGRFCFTGWVPYAGMPDHIALADIVVSASETEGLSRVYLEAMASGKVLICSDIAPAKEVIRDGVNGLLFRKGDPADLAEKIRAVAGDRVLRERLGRAARRDARRFGLARAVDAYESLLSSLASGRY